MRENVNDIEINYHQQGQGEKVILVHGLAEDHESFSKVQNRLKNFTTYALDLRGHGETTLGDADGSLLQLGDDLIGFLEKIGGPAACVGYSLGGTIVLWAAARRPDLVNHLTLIGSSTKVGHAAKDFFQQRIKQLRSDRSEFDKALHSDTAAQIINNNIDVNAITSKRLHAIGSGEGYINAAKAMMAVHDQPLTDLLEKIHCPVDVIGADGDVFCPKKAADMILDALPNAEYHEIEKAGHLMSVDQPDSYSQMIETILNRRTL